ncbi:hypothetical protein GF361_04185 [Candidatus Woesearchaeota archaeon]|nr:hypothetical protein [Candidatus Woesearchaeota archaeon]
MVKQFLITRPNYDKATAYIHSFSKDIVADAKEDAGIHITDLEGSKATDLGFEKAIKKSKPKLVFLNGHGDETVVLGHNDEPILTERNVGLLKGKIIYALACESLAKLGRIAVEKGVKAYVGYEEEFRWVVDPSRTSTPDKDKNAAPFRKVCLVLGKSLLSGVSAGKSIELTRKEYKRLIKNYGTSADNYGDAPLIGLALSWNLLFLGFAGDKAASF